MGTAFLFTLALLFSYFSVFGDINACVHGLSDKKDAKRLAVLNCLVAIFWGLFYYFTH